MEPCDCCETGEKRYGRIATTSDDTDDMNVSIHPSEQKPNGKRSKAWWMTVNFRGYYQRRFYINYCPFCGRELNPRAKESNTRYN